MGREDMMNLGRVGVWSIGLRSDDPAARGEITEAAAELEELGYGTIWLGGSPAVTHATPVLEATSRITVATGILNIWAHDPADVAAAHAGLAANNPGRFVLGLGVSHARSVDPMVPGGYRRPLATMREFLARLDAASTPVPRSERVLAALGPRMLELSRDDAAGAHPYFVTVEHTRRAREVLGTGPVLAPEVKVVLESDPGRARAAARQHLDRYMGLPNYTNNLLRLGFSEDDIRDGGSDRLVDATVAWGGLAAIRERVAAHHDAGADHVCVQVITDDPRALPRSQWRDLAAALDLTGAR